MTGLALIAAEVPGRQTVPRAEALAPALPYEQAERLATGTGFTRVAIDATYALNGDRAFFGEVWGKSKALLRNSNGDIWARLSAATGQEAEKPRVEKIKSHL